jgi:hypothetical protein
LVPNTRLRARQQLGQAGDRLHQLHAVGFVFQALVDLDERHHAARVQHRRHRLAVDHPVHRALEQDRADHLAAAERRRGDDARTHRVDQAEHFLVAGPGAFFDAIALQRLGRRTARLVERGDKAIAGGDFLGLFSMVHGRVSVVRVDQRIPMREPKP